MQYFRMLHIWLSFSPKITFTRITFGATPRKSLQDAHCPRGDCLGSEYERHPRPLRHLLRCQCCDEQSDTDHRDLLSYVTMLGDDAECSSAAVRLVLVVCARSPFVSVISRLSDKLCCFWLVSSMYWTSLEPHGTDSVVTQRSVLSIVIYRSSDKSSRVWKTFGVRFIVSHHQHVSSTHLVRHTHSKW